MSQKETEPSTTSDPDGYPSDDFLHWLRRTQKHAMALGLAAEYFNASGYGKATREGKRLTLITAGWSGCEDVIDALRDNLRLWTTYWAEPHRGGKWVFETSDEQSTCERCGRESPAGERLCVCCERGGQG